VAVLGEAVRQLTEIPQVRFPLKLFLFFINNIQKPFFKKSNILQYINLQLGVTLASGSGSGGKPGCS